MKKVFFSVAVVSALALASCGGGAKADGEKLCNCMKEAMKDMSKMEECQKMGEEMEKKYPKGSDDYKVIDEVMDKCQEEVMKEMGGGEH
jgi:hypothetical protein